MSDHADWPGGWPEEALEHLGRCPICDGTARDLLFNDLTDVNQRCAPGYWKLWTCANCGSGYLDPRPTEKSLVRAYATYPTHRVTSSKDNRRTGVRRFAITVRNSYLNNRYGVHRRPANRWSWPLMYLLPPPLRLEWDHFMRHLPRPAPGRNRLLDIGCGNGDFLLRAKDAGWEVSGLDFDPAAAQTALRRGVEVRVGRLEDSAYAEASFDIVTANQVIEHVHDPIAFLRTCWTLVRPGGRLWIGTPNLVTPVAKQFGVHWSMLDTPRHLALFTASSLSHAFLRAGIKPPAEYQHRGWCMAWVMQDSANIARGALANTVDRIDASMQLTGAWQEIGAWMKPSRGVEITAVVHKPV